MTSHPNVTPENAGDTTYRVDTGPAGEFRHFIGLTSTGMHFALSTGPGRPEDLPPNEPLEFGGGHGFVFPVSAEIADEWTRDDR